MRKLTGLMAMVMLAVLVAACGDDGDDGGDATEEATEAAVSTEVEEAVETAEDEAAADGTAVGGVADEVESPLAGGTPMLVATPEETAAVAAASPAAEEAVVATPESATPAARSGVAAAPVGTGSSPAGGDPVTLSGEVTLPGTLGETFVVTDEGCVGLNGYSDMRAGRQLVVRDEAGTIVGVTTLEATDATNSCAWSFAVDVPESEFYAVSVPMVTERVFTNDEVQADGGEITVPLR